jgi:hypothetical protein
MAARLHRWLFSLTGENIPPGQARLPGEEKHASGTPDHRSVGLLHEDLIWSLFPLHVGMRQYWRDLDSLERWTRSEPHRRWWQQFLKDSGGTGFWHEAYFMHGGIDAIYDDMAKPTGMARFAPATPARGVMFSARHRAGREGTGPDRAAGGVRGRILRSGRRGRAEGPRSRDDRVTGLSSAASASPEAAFTP